MIFSSGAVLNGGLIMKTETSPLLTRQRDYWFDNIKGVLMIFVVIGHMTASFYSVSGGIKYIYDCINSMHMGTFLILSGYMSKGRVARKDYVGVINKNIIPYITAQVFLYVYANLIPRGFKGMAIEFFDCSTFSFFIPIYQLWYLMAVIIFVLVTIKLKPERRPVLFMIGAIALTLICGAIPQVKIFRLTKIISHYPFFLLGYLLPKDFMLALRNKKKLIIAALAVFAGYAYFMSRQDWVVNIRSIYGLSGTYKSGGELAFGIHPVFGRLAMILFIPIVAFAFYTVMPRCKTIFSKLGQNSMYIFVLHSLVVCGFRCLNYEHGILKKYLMTPTAKALFLVFSVAVAFILGSELIRKIFRPLLEPKIDIVNIVGVLYGKYREREDARVAEVKEVKAVNEVTEAKESTEAKEGSDS